MVYGLTGQRLPVHPHPLPNELLTHWFFRLARANRLKVQSLADVVLGPQNAFWARDQDRQPSPGVIQRLSDLTGQPIDAIRALTLEDHQGIGYLETGRSGVGRWVLPLGIFHRKRRKHAVQFCPLCLFEDPDPYYRRQWRLAFVTMCDKHGIMLHDRCPGCGAPVSWHRSDVGRSRNFLDLESFNCWQCDFDLRRASAVGPPTIDGLSAVELRSLAMFHDLGWWFGGPGGLPYAHQYLDVLRHLVSWLPSKWGRPLLSKVCADAGWSDDFSRAPAFEYRPVEERHRLMSIGVWLLQEWPERFVRIAREIGLTQAYVLEGHRFPYWFESAVREWLGAGFVHRTAEEVASIARFLGRHNQPVNAQAIGRLTGSKDCTAVSIYAVPRGRPSQGEFEKVIGSLGAKISELRAGSHRRLVLKRDLAMFHVAWLTGLSGSKVRRLTVAQGIALRLDKTIAEDKRRRVAGIVLSYLRDVRPRLMAGKDAEWLFPAGVRGTPITADNWRQRWKRVC